MVESLVPLVPRRSILIVPVVMLEASARLVAVVAVPDRFPSNVVAVTIPL